MPPTKGKIGVLVESHFYETEYHRFGAFFPELQPFRLPFVVGCLALALGQQGPGGRRVLLDGGHCSRSCFV